MTSPEKQAEIIKASKRLSAARLRLNNTAMAADFGNEEVEIAYRLAQAEFNEATAEMDRVTQANFQPE